MINNITLVGMPGSGKTTLGVQLAQQMKMDFIDLDHQIEEQAGTSIIKIFKKFGENYFRKTERLILEEMLQMDNVVISTGGGAPCFDDNMNLINKNSTAVYLKVSVEELVKRLSNNTENERPMFKNLAIDEVAPFLHKMLSQRDSDYSKAQIVIEGDKITVADILSKLMR